MKCPGQDTRFWKEDAIYESRCPNCGESVEFFKDDPSRKCPNCGHRFVNPEMDFGCAAYCQFAEQCLGSLPDEIKEKQKDLLKDKVGLEVRRLLLGRPKDRQHAQTTARYAERLGKDLGGNLGPIIMAAHLKQINALEKETGSEQILSDTETLKSESLSKSILEKFGADESVMEKVLSIVDQVPAADSKSSIETQVVHDADRLADLEEELKTNSLTEKELEKRINSDLLTGQAGQLARNLVA